MLVSVLWNLACGVECVLVSVMWNLACGVEGVLVSVLLNLACGVEGVMVSVLLHKEIDDSHSLCLVRVMTIACDAKKQQSRFV